MRSTLRMAPRVAAIVALLGLGLFVVGLGIRERFSDSRVVASCLSGLSCRGALFWADAGLTLMILGIAVLGVGLLHVFRNVRHAAATAMSTPSAPHSARGPRSLDQQVPFQMSVGDTPADVAVPTGASRPGAVSTPPPAGASEQIRGGLWCEACGSSNAKWLGGRCFSCGDVMTSTSENTPGSTCEGSTT